MRRLSFLFPLLIVAIGAGPEGVSLKNVVRGNNQFALDLHGKTRDREGNLFFSPYSVSTALAMTSTGAAGETAQEMAATLHLPAAREELVAGFKDRGEQLFGGDAKKSYQLATANALWGQSGLDYSPTFLDGTALAFKATLHPLDFANDPEAARRTINEWVERQTLDKIRDLLPGGSVKRDTDLILTNAIYFKAAWEKPFSKTLTIEEDFQAAKGKVKTPFMNRATEFRYLDAEADGLQVVDLPYAGNALAMTVLLPRQVDGIEKLEASITVEKLDGWLSRLSPPQMVKLAMPRFKLEQSLNLGETLQSLGMRLAFGSQADFSGITTSRHLFLSAVVHKAFVEVNEEGTEAAAATGVLMTRSAVMIPRQPPVVFRADHPFLFLIRDLRSGSILFFGRMANPS